MKEIVAARIGTTITNKPSTIVKAIENGTVSEFLDRQHMQLMSAFDLGQRWTNLANGRTLFIVDDEGNTQLPE